MTAMAHGSRPFFPPLPEEAQEAADGEPIPYLGDLVILVRDLSPTEAHLLCGCLQSAGIHADAGDAHIVQAHGLLTIAVGGAKVRVPSAQLEEARGVLAAFRRGDFALGDDFDPGEGKG